MEEFYCVVTFHVTQHALVFESYMKERDIQVKLMPVPRQISSSCGTAAQIPCHLQEEILKLCQEEDLPIDEFHRIRQDKDQSWFSKYLSKKK